MTDLTTTIKAKSDQLNADDLIGNSMVLKVTNVRVPGGDQPVVINYEGDQGKPYKPSKGMRRVLVAAWGNDGAKYVGRSIKVFYEPSVTWAGEKVGGIRISELSHLSSPVVLALALNGRQKIPYTVKPMQVPKTRTIEEMRTDLIAKLQDEGKEIDHESIMDAQDQKALVKIYEKAEKISVDDKVVES